MALDNPRQHQRPRTSKSRIACKRDGGFDSRPPPLPGLLASPRPRSRGPSPFHRAEKPVGVSGHGSGPEEPVPTSRPFPAPQGRPNRKHLRGQDQAEGRLLQSSRIRGGGGDPFPSPDNRLG